MCFIQISFLSLALYTEALQLLCIYKRSLKLLFFYNLVFIFIPHRIARSYQLVINITKYMCIKDVRGVLYKWVDMLDLI
jgi:hypothetical protein